MTLPLDDSSVNRPPSVGYSNPNDQAPFGLLVGEKSAAASYTTAADARGTSAACATSIAAAAPARVSGANLFALGVMSVLLGFVHCAWIARDSARRQRNSAAGRCFSHHAKRGTSKNGVLEFGPAE